MAVEISEEFLSPAQAGKLLGVTALRVRQIAQSGRLACTVTPLGRLYRRQDVEQLRQERAGGLRELRGL